MHIVADRRAMKQIAVNLLSNAVKFTPDGGSVTVRTRRLENSVMLMIADTGIGIAPQSLKRLGRPFEQVESQLSKTYHGSGLGLAIAKSLAKLHGGSMRLRSKLGNGTVVMVTLPRDISKLSAVYARALRLKPLAFKDLQEHAPDVGLRFLQPRLQRRKVRLVRRARQQPQQSRRPPCRA